MQRVHAQDWLNNTGGLAEWSKATDLKSDGVRSARGFESCTLLQFIMTKTPEQLLNDLAKEGGAIVCTDSCTPLEIAAARANGDMAVREDGVGFIRRQKLYVEKADAALLGKKEREMRTTRRRKRRSPGPSFRAVGCSR